MPREPLRGEVNVPGDKSITHRAILLSAIAQGVTRITTRTLGRDNLSTLRIMTQLGVRAELELPPALFRMACDEGLGGISQEGVGSCVATVYGHGIQALRPAESILDCGNSGTTARLLCGILANRPFQSKLTGDESLQRRPFRRVAAPLTKMGASFSAERLPFTISGGALRGIEWRSEISSAQVKSAVLLAGLEAVGEVSVVEPHRSRDHTERMFAGFGVPCVEGIDLQSGGWRVALSDAGSRKLSSPGSLIVPGDFSAAAFFMVAGTIIPGSEICIRDVGVNATRVGLQQILSRMGARIQLENCRESGGEQVADLVVTAAPLRGVQLGKQDVALAIDEIPILAVAAACAEGETVIAGAEELRVKESDRISMMAAVLSAAGVPVEERPDGMVITGRGAAFNAALSRPVGPGRDCLDLGRPNPGCLEDSFGVEPWHSCGDHRIFMSAAVLRYLITGQFGLDSAQRKMVETSFPLFEETFLRLIGREISH